MSRARSRIVTKSDVLGLHRPKSRKHPFIHVRVTVERGSICVESLEKRFPFQKQRINTQHDLKSVWVNNMLDDECSQVKNCFVVITPETTYILQASTHRSKIEWMQSLSIAISQSLKFRGSYRPSSWNNLDDLQKWLMIREVEYTFQSHERYKGATYHGKWNAGMPHICGSMKWPNGDRYDGEFMFEKFHGTGTMRWLLDKNKRSYTGRWQDGRMEGHGEMTYADQSVYTGWWHMGKRHGHGSMEYKPTNSVYIGAWESDMRSGYGMLNNGIKSERYLGMWQEDKYHGAGILVAENQFYYSGMFANGERNITSTAGVRVVVQDNKWESLFQSCTVLLEQMVSISHSNPEIGHSLEPDATFFADDGLINFQNIGASPNLDASCENCHTILKDTEECVVCRVEGFKSADHPFGILVNNLTRCFNESYSGVGSHKNMLPHAIGELYSVAVRLHQLVSRFCPSVITNDENNLLGRPTSQLTMMLKARRGDMSRRISTCSQKTNADPSWLYPILLPSTFQTLFALYTKHYSEDDHRLAKLMTEVNQRDDKELCVALGLKSEFEQWREKHNEGSFSECFSGAVQIFQKINEYLTPLNKLLCIQEANGEVAQVWKAVGDKERDSPISCSVEESEAISTGLFSLVILKSQVTHLCSEIQFIQDFAGTTLLTENYGFLMTLLKDCYYQILDIERTS